MMESCGDVGVATVYVNVKLIIYLSTFQFPQIAKVTLHSFLRLERSPLSLHLSPPALVPFSACEAPCYLLFVSYGLILASYLDPS